MAFASARSADALRARFDARTARVGVVGLGYVGLPLAGAFVDAGYAVTGLDIDPEKVTLLNAGRSYIRQIPQSRVAALVATGRFTARAEMAAVAALDAVCICVPTPLADDRSPDLSFVLETGRSLAPHLRAQQLVVLESTTYPGTTRQELKPILEAGSGLVAGRDFHLAYSPEREEPGVPEHTAARLPKLIGGDGETALALAAALYRPAVAQVVPVSSPEVAEAAKLTENIFRAVNIALVNELKLVYARMGIDVWEVIAAARTKPFGFMPFYPGPGLGGHCIPIDPFYLAWAARRAGTETRFIELAGEINEAMPDHVVATLAAALAARAGRGLDGASILLLGIAYKKNVDDTRESPGLRLMRLLRDRGARVAYHDPFVPTIPRTREYPDFAGEASVAWDADRLGDYDAAVIVADHDGIDYAALAARARLVVDTRDATRGLDRTRVVTA